MYKIKLDQFEGPLDLLLQLIENEKLDISQISLAQITDTFINYLDSTKNISLNELADFLVVAAKLLLIKSQILFPNLRLEAEDIPLEQQLKIYKEYWDAAKEIEKIIKRKLFILSKEKMAVEAAFRPPVNLTAQKMGMVFEEIIKHLESFVTTPKQLALKAISLEKRINQLKDLVLKKVMVSFSDLTQTKDKAEKVVHFLAVLELIKQQIVKIEQKSLFSDILIKKA